MELSEDAAFSLMYDAPQDNLLLEMERNQSIESCIKTMTPREEKVIRMRFGFAPYYEEHTLGSVANELEITTERLRQIEAGALRKMRHPSRSGQLKDFV